MIDKFKTCLNCPDRSINPNCHTACEGYIHRCKLNEERRKKRLEDTMFKDFQIDSIIRHRKIKNPAKNKGFSKRFK